MIRLQTQFLHILLAGLLTIAGTSALTADDTNSSIPSTSTPKPEVVVTQDVLRAYLQLQEQLHATQLAIERSRQDAEAAAARNAKTITERLNFLEHILGEQRTANRWMLLIAGAISVMGFLAILLAAYLQWRAVNRLAEMAMMNQLFELGRMPTALGPGEMRLLGRGNVEQTNARLSGALERLEKRIHELRTASQLLPPSAESVTENTEEKTYTAKTDTMPSANDGQKGASQEDSFITLLLGKGQSLLSLGEAGAAIDCFDKILSLDPNHVKALIKKGTALERLQKFDEAIACYDCAIKTDNSNTLAYLYKGGIFNRLERHNEALECYEQALKTQEKGHGA